MKTINQINQWVKNNQTIQLYFDCENDQNKWVNNWRNNSYIFDFGRGPDSRTIAGNFLFGACYTEFERFKNDKSKYYDYSRDNRHETVKFEFSGYQINIQVDLRQSFKGVFLEYSFGFNNNERVFHRSIVKSNSTFKELDIKAYFMKHEAKKLFHPEGLFRNIQILRNCTKRAALEVYQNFLSKPYKKHPEYIDTKKAIAHRFTKKLNCELCDSISEKTALNLLNTMKRQKTRKKIYKHLSPFDLSDIYLSENDTEENMESWLSDYLEENYPKNSIFI